MQQRPAASSRSKSLARRVQLDQVLDVGLQVARVVEQAHVQEPLHALADQRSGERRRDRQRGLVDGPVAGQRVPPPRRRLAQPGRRDQAQAVDQVGPLERQVQRDRAAQRVADHGRALELELLEQRREEVLVEVHQRAAGAPRRSGRTAARRSRSRGGRAAGRARRGASRRRCRRSRGSAGSAGPRRRRPRRSTTPLDVDQPVRQRVAARVVQPRMACSLPHARSSVCPIWVIASPHVARITLAGPQWLVSLIVGCGCRGQALARALQDDGHQVRGTTRDPVIGCADIEAAGAEGVVADPYRLATVTPLLDGRQRRGLAAGSATGTRRRDRGGPQPPARVAADEARRLRRARPGLRGGRHVRGDLLARAPRRCARRASGSACRSRSSSTTRPTTTAGRARCAPRSGASSARLGHELVGQRARPARAGAPRRRPARAGARRRSSPRARARAPARPRSRAPRRAARTRRAGRSSSSRAGTRALGVDVDQLGVHAVARGEEAVLVEHLGAPRSSSAIT